MLKGEGGHGGQDKGASDASIHFLPMDSSPERMRLIVYEQHARERMSQRGVTEADVALTLGEPDEQRPARRLQVPCVILLKRIGDRTCKVYIREGSDPPVVATAAWHGEKD